MKMIDCVANRILELCRERNLAVNALARSAGMPPSTVKNILNGASKNPGVVMIKRLCDGLGISVAEFFDTEEFRNLEQESDDGAQPKVKLRVIPHHMNSTQTDERRMNGNVYFLRKSHTNPN